MSTTIGNLEFSESLDNTNSSYAAPFEGCISTTSYTNHSVNASNAYDVSRKIINQDNSRKEAISLESRLNTIISNLEKQSQVYEKTIKSNEEVIRKLTEITDNQSKQIRCLSSRVSDLEAKYDALTKTSTAQVNKINILNAAIVEKDREISDLKLQNKDLSLSKVVVVYQKEKKEDNYPDWNMVNFSTWGGS
jgi:uncharacterized coiled-coil protein SlyX